MKINKKKIAKLKMKVLKKLLKREAIILYEQIGEKDIREELNNILRLGAWM